MNKNIKRMAEMDMKKLIMVMSMPAIISMFVQAMYNVVDSAFIANINNEALTAVSLVFPMQMIMISIAVGLTVGVNSFVSRKIGEGKMDLAAAAAEHGIIIGIIAWVIIAVCNYFFGEMFLRLFTNDEQVLLYSLQYANIVVYLSVGMILSLIFISISQATGDMVSPMKIQLIGAIANIILDPIMIFGLLGCPRMDVVGGALATVIGQMISMVYAIWALKHNPLELKLSKLHVNFKLDMGIVKEVMRVGIPSMFMQGLCAVMISGINFILVGFSALSIAAFGTFYKLYAIVIMPIVGLTQGMMPVVGYNFGARDKSRIKAAVKYSLIYSVAFMFFGTLVLAFFAEPIMRIFSDIPELVALGVNCIRIISIGFVLQAVTIIVSSSFQAFGIAKISLYASFLRQIIFLFPLAYFLSKLFGTTGVWSAFPITEALSLLFTVVYALKAYKTIVKPAVAR